MSDKYVKDGAHNRYPAYCCEDIDERLGKLEQALADLVAGTVPDGAVTLAKLADDARSWSREINKGLLTAEWIGTKAEYEAHLAENGGEPLANVKYIITDAEKFARVTSTDFPIGSILLVYGTYIDKIGNIRKNATDDTKLYIGIYNNRYTDCAVNETKKDFFSSPVEMIELEGEWICCGGFIPETMKGYSIYQRIA